VRPVGSVDSSSRSMTVVRCVLCTSTVGASPVTVTVSWTLPTFSSALTVAVKFDGKGIASLTKEENPGNVKLTV
jgi:hypothetical protein